MSYSHVTEHERYVIYHLVLYGLSFREIGRRLKRHHTTISREYRRNRGALGNYWHEAAQQRALTRRKQSRHRRRQAHQPLVAYVTHALRQDWSPEIIMHRLRQAFPRNKVMRVSSETIYQWVFADAAAGGDLHQHLMRRHRKRRRQKRYGALRGVIPNRVGIEHRPAGADNRSRFGHWEGDTVERRKGSDPFKILASTKT